MEPRFELPCRSIRIGSLKTTLPLNGNKLKFSKKGFRFHAEIEGNNGQKEIVKFVIPVENIKLIEGHLGKGCPVIWISTDTPYGAKIRRLCHMQEKVNPAPYFDPSSEELAERRICVIPVHDPINERQLLKFRAVLSFVASLRKTTVDEIFHDLTKSLCNEQLVKCTRRISEIIKLQAAWKLKKERTLSNECGGAVIVLSSDDDDDSELLVGTGLVSTNNTSVREDGGYLSQQPVNGDSHLPKLVANTNRDLHRGLVKPENSDGLLTTDESLKRKTSDGSNLSSVSKKQKLSKEMDGSSKFSQIKKNESSGSGAKMNITDSTKSHQNGSMHTPPRNTSPSVTKENQTKDVRSLRGSSLLNADMMTLQLDAESMVAPTPLCICVMKSQYAVNFTHHKIACMAIDNIDGRLFGCTNLVSESHMMRASKNLPAQALCSDHKSRMISHECCPCCGTFCSGGTFLICSSTKEHQHRFHKHCLVLTRHSQDCPHCGCPMSDIHEVTIGPIFRPLSKYESEDRGIVEKSPEKKKQSSYPRCVETVPGLTLPLPESFISNEVVHLRIKREALDLMIKCLDEEIPKKARFQPKNLFQHVKQGDLAKAMQLLCLPDCNPNCRNPAAKDLRTSLHEAVIRGNFAMVHLLVTAGADVNLPDEDGKTPIFFAESQNRLDILIYLICSGGNLIQGDLDGMLPLHYAAKEGRLKACMLLLKYGKKAINFVDEGGWTPLVWSAEHRRTDIARCLTYFDANMHSVDKEGNICLQWAALAGNTEILLMCLRKNSNINHQNTLGDTALHIAAREDNRQCVVLLLAWGADPLIHNNEGKTAADGAKDSSLCQVALLMNAMTRCAITDHKGFEPLDRERLLSSDISRGKEKIAISCVNATDEVPCPVNPPHEFLYISKNIHKHTSVNTVKNIMMSCRCDKECMSCQCGPCWYDLSGRLLPSFDYNNPPSIVECNPFCKCPKSCPNRVIQRGGVKFRIQLYRTNNIGWGVRAVDEIRKGSYLCEYIGEVISNADTRDDDQYLFDLSAEPNGLYSIDGRSYGNVSRFFNHHCEPNLVPVRFYYDHQDRNFPRIAFFSKRHILPGEQLCFDYGKGFWDAKCESFTCECESDYCKYSEKAYRKRMDETPQTEQDGIGTSEGRDLTNEAQWSKTGDVANCDETL